MSLETSKKLGIVSSLIYVICPIISSIISALFIFQLFTALSTFVSSATSSGSIPELSSLLASVSALSFGSQILGAFELAGFVLFLVTMYLLSKYYNAYGIFWNILKAFLVMLVTVVIAIIAIVLVVFVALGSGLGSSTAGVGFGLGLIAALIVLIGVIFAVAIYCGFLYKRAFDLLADKSGVGEFKTMGLLYLIGTIIPIISWIGWIFAALGYSKLKATPPQPESYSSVAPPQPEASQSSQTAQATKTCASCGAENVLDANYCCVCGSQIP
ncbi:MAG: DUF996 domain-containing protein [Nitrososphaerota archaeon]|nr:DUF996 domain-containing protein [Nitrososphaerota archaeon]